MTNIVPKTNVLMASDILAEALRDMDKIIRATESAKLSHLLCDPNVATNWQFPGDSHWKTANFVHKNDPKTLSEQRIDSFISLIKFIINNPKDSSVIYSNLSVDHRRLLIRLLGELQLALDAEPSKQKAVSKMKIFRSATSPNPFTESPNSPSISPNVTLAGGLNGHDHQSAFSPNLRSPTLPLSNKGADWKQSQPAGLCVNGTDSLDSLNLLTELARQQTQIANLEKAKRELEVQLLDLRERFADLSKPTKPRTVCTGSENNHFQQPLDEAQSNKTTCLYEPKQQPWSNGQKLNTSSGPDTNLLLAKQMDDKERNRLANTPSYVTFPNSPQGVSAPTTVSNFPLVQFSLAPPGQPRTPTRGDNSINHNPYKSVSLSELHHSQFDFLDTQPFAPSVLPRFILKQSKITGHGTSVSPSLSTVPVASAASIGTTHLPPQYANGCHRQTHLFNKSPAPALTTNTDLSRIVQTASRTLSPRPSTQTSIFSASDQAHTPVNGHQSLWTNSLVRRAKTPTERLDRSVVHPMTTSKPLCQSEVRVPMVTLNDNVELLSGYPDDSNSRSAWTKTNKNSRIKQFFTETRFVWLCRSRNLVHTTQSANGNNVSSNTATSSQVDLLHETPNSRSNSLRITIPESSGSHTNLPGGKMVSKVPQAIVLREKAHLGANGMLNRDTFSRQSVPCLSTSQIPTSWVCDRPIDSTSGPTPQFVQASCLDVNAIDESEDIDFIHWDKDVVSAWMYELGLGYAVPATRRWLRRGADLVYASRKQIEHQMGIRNPLHLKKLLLHMQLRTKEPLLICPSLPLLRMKLPPEFNVAAWLDDLGLTTYTAAFSAAGIDQLTLNNLTMDDLASMKITNELHVLSIRRGLQILRRVRFNLSALSRGPNNADSSFDLLHRTGPCIEKQQQKEAVELIGNGSTPSSGQASPKKLPSEQSGSSFSSGRSTTLLQENPASTKISERLRVASVCYWTQYRVMTWLYSIELPEYAPDLSGSGVHGALMVLEDRFTPDLLANILHVPASKTLVRRHLISKFAELVGEEMWQRKLDAMNNSAVPPLTQHSKLKLPRKRSLFAPQRRHNGFELEDNLVCPLDIDLQHANLFIGAECPTDSVHSESPSVQLNLSDGDWTPSQSLSTEPSDQNGDT